MSKTISGGSTPNSAELALIHKSPYNQVVIVCNNNEKRFSHAGVYAWIGFGKAFPDRLYIYYMLDRLSQMTGQRICQQSSQNIARGP
jgi:hypothetical protein